MPGRRRAGDPGRWTARTPGHGADAGRLARVHVHGAAGGLGGGAGGGRRVDLPTYAFQRQRYWPQAPRALASRRPEPERPATEGWRYRVSWVPVPDPVPAVLTGTWLVVAPAGLAGGDLADACVRALTARGARVVVAETVAGEAERVALAARIGEVLPAEPAEVVRVISLLALDEVPLRAHPAVSAGLAGTQALAQALGDAGVGAPLWVLTCGAVSAGPARGWPARCRRGLGPGSGGGPGASGPVGRPGRPAAACWTSGRAARLCGVLAGCEEDQVAIRRRRDHGAAAGARRAAPRPRRAVGAARHAC